MYSNSFITVITCFFNEERFIKETIESVLFQSHKQWELLLVDDGSSDNSTLIAKQYSEQYPEKIFYLEHVDHSNKGLSASRNFGISKARGELIAFLDADDVWLPEKLKHQLGIMLAYPNVGLVCEASLYWYSWHENDRKDVLIKVGKDYDIALNPPLLAERLYPLSDGDAPCPSGIMVRKTVLEKVKGFESHFTGSYQMYEDQAFLFKIYLSEIVFVSSGCHNKYRQREGSLVHKISKEGNYDMVRRYFLEWAIGYYSSSKFKYPKVLELLNKTFFSNRYPFFAKIKRRLLNK